MVKKAEKSDLSALTALALQLWPGHSAEAMESDLAETMAGENAAFFLAWEGGQVVGFAQTQLRHDYVEGTDSSPVGYLEGIYVAEGFRNRGVARTLLAACENWAKAKGCAEFASDCELDNLQSLAFHLRMGFAEANRIICFAKKL